jgi:hypothetical protein
VGPRVIGMGRPERVRLTAAFEGDGPRQIEFAIGLNEHLAARRASASISPAASTIHAPATVHSAGAATATPNAGRAPAAISAIARRVG